MRKKGIKYISYEVEQITIILALRLLVENMLNHVQFMASNTTKLRTTNSQKNSEFSVYIHFHTKNKVQNLCLSFTIASQSKPNFGQNVPFFHVKTEKIHQNKAPQFDTCF